MKIKTGSIDVSIHVLRFSTSNNDRFEDNVQDNVATI